MTDTNVTIPNSALDDRLAKYTLTPEHRAQLKPWAEKWIANALSTKAMDDDDRRAMREAVIGLYEAANLTPPPLERIVFVPSPLVGNVASGFAAAIWWLRKNKATDAATYAATRAATYAATDAATRAATYAATYAATHDATRAATHDATRAATDAATDAATRAATYAATRAATDAATRAATYAATRAATYAATHDATRAATHDATDAATYAATHDATRAATHDATDAAGWAINLSVKFLGGHFNFGLSCARGAWRMCSGGNHWSGWIAYLSFFRHVAKLDLPVYEKWRHYEAAAIHGSWRWMHPEFCIVSDRPCVLRLDDQNRPHCADGPSHEWRDGWKLYYWHGVRVPDHWITNTASVSAGDVLREQNVEVRRAGCEILGWSKILKDLNARIIDTDADPEIGTLVEVDLPDLSVPSRFLRVRCGTGREFAVCVPPTTTTALGAQAWMVGMNTNEFQTPEIRT